LSNELVLYRVFSEALSIDADDVHNELAYNEIAEWDSVAHMALVAAIETEFNVLFDTDDVIGMKSVKVAKDILTKHGVNF